jgi:hypothetical protein
MQVLALPTQQGIEPAVRDLRRDVRREAMQRPTKYRS